MTLKKGYLCLSLLACLQCLLQPLFQRSHAAMHLCSALSSTAGGGRPDEEKEGKIMIERRGPNRALTRHATQQGSSDIAHAPESFQQEQHDTLASQSSFSPGRSLHSVKGLALALAHLLLSPWPALSPSRAPPPPSSLPLPSLLSLPPAAAPPPSLAPLALSSPPPRPPPGPAHQRVRCHGLL
eukprot:976800-Rhodomonas_salina.5